MRLRQFALGFTIVGTLAATCMTVVIVQGTRDHARLIDLQSASDGLARDVAQLLAVTHDFATYGHERAAQQVAAYHRRVGLALDRMADSADLAQSEPLDALRTGHQKIGELFANWNLARQSASVADDSARKSVLLGQLVIDAQAMAEDSRQLALTIASEIVRSRTTLLFVVSAALGGLFVLLLIAGAVLWLHVLRPLRRIEHALSLVKRGVYKQQLVDTVTSRDEFGDLAREFDRMAAEIARRTALMEESNQALETMNRQLELRVEERTREIARHADALEQSNIELQRFAYVASHDLQTPLRSIAGFTQLVQRAAVGKLGADAERWMSIVVDNTQHMQRLIRDLLSYARVDSRSRAFVPVSLATVFDSVIELLDASIRDANAVVTRDDLPVVQGDPSQLTQLLQNLIANSIIYHGDQPPRIHVSTDPGNNAESCTLCVSDNGMGIDPVHQERIFDIFQRLHTQQEYPGTGLGLAVCRRVASRHGGRIWVESRPGEGSVFKITFPAHNLAEQVHEQSTAS